jgi:hypothetical protein
MEIITYFCPRIHPEKFASEDSYNAAINVLFIGLFLAYDTKLPFVPQLTKNFEDLKMVFQNSKDDD